ncbi:hypothetical protein C8Q76DRAFT_694542 [Earliella scabrosa]|nr:hypothetical protein C8Q76DRAFT_694542 [Earliella scabrosa]
MASASANVALPSSLGLPLRSCLPPSHYHSMLTMWRGLRAPVYDPTFASFSRTMEYLGFNMAQDAATGIVRFTPPGSVGCPTLDIKYPAGGVFDDGDRAFICTDMNTYYHWTVSSFCLVYDGHGASVPLYGAEVLIGLPPSRYHSMLTMWRGLRAPVYDPTFASFTKTMQHIGFKISEDATTGVVSFTHTGEDRTLRIKYPEGGIFDVGDRAFICSDMYTLFGWRVSNFCLANIAPNDAVPVPGSDVRIALPPQLYHSILTVLLGVQAPVYDATFASFAKVMAFLGLRMVKTTGTQTVHFVLPGGTAGHWEQSLSVNYPPQGEFGLYDRVFITTDLDRLFGWRSSTFYLYNDL